RSGGGRAGSEVRLPGGAPRPGGGDGDAAPDAPRRRADGAVPPFDGRIDQRRGGLSRRVHQHGGAGGGADDTGADVGAVAGRGRAGGSQADEGIVAAVFASVAVDRGGGAGVGGAAADPGVQAGAGGVFRQAAGAVGFVGGKHVGELTGPAVGFYNTQ